MKTLTPSWRLAPAVTATHWEAATWTASVGSPPFRLRSSEPDWAEPSASFEARLTVAPRLGVQLLVLASKWTFCSCDAAGVPPAPAPAEPPAAPPEPPEPPRLP